MKKGAFVIVGIILGMAWLSLPALSADTISIGCIVPLSGGVAHYGTNTRRGLEMAIEEVNAAGGVKVKGTTYMMKVESCDDEGKSAPAATCGRKLASQYKTPIIYTPASWSAFPLMSFNESMNFIIQATSQSTTFTQKGNKLVIRWVNSVGTSMGPWVKLLMKHMKLNNLDIKTVGVMEVNTEVGKQWAGAFMEQWQKNGGVITGKEAFDANQTDYYPQLTSLLAKKPDGIMVNVPDEPTSVVIRQARELGFKGPFISSTACDGRKLLELVKPEWAENSFLEVLATGLGGPKFDAFDSKYRARFKEDPVFIASLSYEGGLAMAKAIEKAQSLEPAQIKAAFPAILPLPDCMYCGRDMDPETGDVYFPVYLRIIKGGKLIGVRD